MYTGGQCVALGHNLGGLWFLSLHWGFLLRIRGYVGGMLVGCVWWCPIAGFLVCPTVVVFHCSQSPLLFCIMFQAIYLVLTS